MIESNEEQPMLNTKWIRTRIPGRIIMETRQVFHESTLTHASMLEEQIVLESMPEVLELEQAEHVKRRR